MARFYGTVKGSRGEASRLGHTKSGLRTTCSSAGIGVECSANAYDTDDTENDVIDVYVDGGFDGARGHTLGYVKRVGGEVLFQLDGLGSFHLLKPTPENLEALRFNKPLMDALFAHLWIRGDLPRGVEEHETA